MDGRPYNRGGGNPSFRGRSPHHQFHNQRFGGGGGGTPRQWRPRNQSPYYHPPHQQLQSPHFGNFNSPSPGRMDKGSPYDASTPMNHSFGGSGGRRHFHHRGGGGRGRGRQSFGSPSFGQDKSDDIERWIRPEMWQDPWSQFTGGNSIGDSLSFKQEGFSLTSDVPEEDANPTNTFSESDFDVSDKVSDSKCPPMPSNPENEADHHIPQPPPDEEIAQ